LVSAPLQQANTLLFNLDDLAPLYSWHQAGRSFREASSPVQFGP